jgi:hypothetical protein
MLRVKFSLFSMLTANVRLVGKLYYIILTFEIIFLTFVSLILVALML